MQQAVLKSPAVGAFDYFGYSVAIAAVLTDGEQKTKMLVAVGANGEDSVRPCSICPVDRDIASTGTEEATNDDLEG